MTECGARVRLLTTDLDLPLPFFEGESSSDNAVFVGEIISNG